MKYLKLQVKKMNKGRYEDTILELKEQRRVAMNVFKESRLAKNEALAEYFFSKFKEGKDVPFSILQSIPVGEALLLPVVYGGAIITTKQISSNPNEIVYVTKWTAGSTLTMHYHSDSSEVILVKEGRAKVFVGNNTYILEKGDTIDIASGIPHQITALQESILKVYFKRILT
jgi:quercetin dioxygenase-like cupin family protein